MTPLGISKTFKAICLKPGKLLDQDIMKRLSKQIGNLVSLFCWNQHLSDSLFFWQILAFLAFLVLSFHTVWNNFWPEDAIALKMDQKRPKA